MLPSLGPGVRDRRNVLLRWPVTGPAMRTLMERLTEPGGLQPMRADPLARGRKAQGVLMGGHYGDELISGDVSAIRAHGGDLCRADRCVHLHFVIDKTLALLGSRNPAGIASRTQEAEASGQSLVLLHQQCPADRLKGFQPSRSIQIPIRMG